MTLLNDLYEVDEVRNLQILFKSTKPVSADTIANLAEKGEDVSRFFKGEGRMVQPIQRVNVDITAGMLKELDQAALTSTSAAKLSSKRWSGRLSINTTWRNARVASNSLGQSQSRPDRRQKQGWPKRVVTPVYGEWPLDATGFHSLLIQVATVAQWHKIVSDEGQGHNQADRGRRLANDADPRQPLAVPPSTELDPKTLASILKQAGLK